MVTFIANQIEKAAKKSTEEGKKKYEAYFVRTRIYAQFREDVDTILRTDGYEEVISEE